MKIDSSTGILMFVPEKNETRERKNENESNVMSNIIRVANTSEK